VPRVKLRIRRAGCASAAPARENIEVHRIRRGFSLYSHQDRCCQGGLTREDCFAVAATRNLELEE